MSPWVLIATSATIGAAVSAIVNLVGLLAGQALERRWRRRELLLTKAIELASKKSERMLAVAGQSNYRKSIIDDEVFLARAYFEDLDRLLDSGKLGQASEAHYERVLRTARENDATKKEKE
jgi:hypothetical protein